MSIVEAPLTGREFSLVLLCFVLFYLCQDGGGT